MSFFTRLKVSRLQKQCMAGNLPDAICRYLEQWENRPSAKTIWNTTRLVALDTETSGLDLKKDHVLSMGGIAIERGAIVMKDSLELVVKSPSAGTDQVIALHGVLPEEVHQGLEVEEALSQLLDFVGHAPIVGHHIGFDVAILNKALKSWHPDMKLLNPTIDTGKLAKKLDNPAMQAFPQVTGGYSLDNLCKRFDIEPHIRHSAWGDALTTAILLQKLLPHFGNYPRLSLKQLVL